MSVWVSVSSILSLTEQVRAGPVRPVFASREQHNSAAKTGILTAPAPCWRASSGQLQPDYAYGNIQQLLLWLQVAASGWAPSF